MRDKQHDKQKLKRIVVGSSSKSGDIASRKRYRVRIDGEWYEGQFSKQWFGWQFDGYRSGIQLNLIDEVYEILITAPPKKPAPKTRADEPGAAAGPRN